MTAKQISNKNGNRLTLPRKSFPLSLIHQSPVHSHESSPGKTEIKELVLDIVAMDGGPK
jgi:hypothetical protein